MTTFPRRALAAMLTATVFACGGLAYGQASAAAAPC